MSRLSQPHEVILLDLLAGRARSLPSDMNLHTTAALALLMQDFSLDSTSFFSKYGHAAVTIFGEVAEALDSTRDDPWVAHRVIALLYQRAVMISIAQSNPDSVPIAGEELDVVGQFVPPNNEAIGALLTELYSLPHRPAGRMLNWSTLRVHRVGTTSIIFRVSDSRHDSLILKLSHVLFKGITPIANANADYTQDWGLVGDLCEHAASIYGSGPGWILEEWVEGVTLRQALEHVRERPINERLMVGGRLFVSVCAALDSFHSLADGRGHGDLNPSNIMIAGKGTTRNIVEQAEPPVVLIDLGRNLLASDMIGRVQAADKKYVAPEVVELMPDVRFTAPEADYYSLGMLLATCFGYSGSDGFFDLPGDLFADFPELARLAAPLLDVDPHMRASYLHHLSPPPDEMARPQTRGLQKAAQEMSHVLQASVKSRQESRSDLVEVITQVLFGDITVFRDQLKRVMSAVRAHGFRGIRAILGPMRTLVAGVALATIAVVLVTPFVDRFGWTLPRESVAAQVQGYLICWTFAVASYQFGTRAFGSVSFLGTGIGGKLRHLTELSTWIASIVVLPLTLVVLIFGSELWPWCVAVGLAFIVLTAISTLRLRSQIDRRIRQVPAYERWYRESDIARTSRTEILSYWTPTLVFYSGFALVLAFLDDPLNQLQDHLIYAVIFACVNTFVITWSQVMRQGPRLRANLCQYMIAAEVLEPTARSKSTQTTESI